MVWSYQAPYDYNYCQYLWFISIGAMHMAGFCTRGYFTPFSKRWHRLLAIIIYYYESISLVHLRCRQHAVAVWCMHVWTGWLNQWRQYTGASTPMHLATFQNIFRPIWCSERKKQCRNENAKACQSALFTPNLHQDAILGVFTRRQPKLKR